MSLTVLFGEGQMPLEDPIRDAFLDVEVAPIVEATIRQVRLDFEDDNSKPWPVNWNVTLDAQKRGEEWKGRIIWGDVSSQQFHIARAFCTCVYEGSSSDTWYMGHFGRITDLGSHRDNWEYELIADTEFGHKVHCTTGCRAGMAAHWSQDKHYTWSLNDDRKITRSTVYYNESTSQWQWLNSTSGGSPLVEADAYSCHPVGSPSTPEKTYDECIVVSAIEGWIWANYIYYDCATATFTVSERQVLWNGEEVKTWWVYFSDAVKVVELDRYVVTLNLGDHGAAYAVTYTRDSNMYSEPLAVLGGGVDDTGYRVFPCGLSAYNDKLWLVTQRAIEGGEGFPYAKHIALASSLPEDWGRHWTDGDFVGEHLCWGKLCYSPGMDPDHCYVVGNAIVYRAATSIRLGYDNPALKHDIVEGISWALQVPPAGGASTIQSEWMNAGEVLSDLVDAGLLVPDNELEVRVGIPDNDDRLTIFKGYLAQRQRIQGYSGLEEYADQFSNRGVGPLYRLSGEGAYHPPGGRLYEGPTPWYTNFTNKAETMGRGSLSSRLGIWEPKPLGRVGHYALRGEPDPLAYTGVSLIPRRWTARSFMMYCRIQFKRSVEGGGFVFFYEGPDDYWYLGVYNIAEYGQHNRYLCLRRKVAGKWYYIESGAITGGVSLDTWYQMYLCVTTGSIRAYLATDYVDSKGVPAQVIQSSTQIAEVHVAIVDMEWFDDTLVLPASYHVGLGVRDRLDFEEADTSGFVSKAYRREIQDVTKDFGPGHVDKWAAVRYDYENIHWGRVADYREELYDEDEENPSNPLRYIALTLDTVFPEVPAIGCDYGLYDEKGSAYIIVDDLGFCDAKPAWSVDSVADDILKLSGAQRKAYGDDRLSTAGRQRDLDLRSLYHADRYVGVRFHLQTPELSRLPSGFAIGYDPSKMDMPYLSVLSPFYSTGESITYFLPSLMANPLEDTRESEWRIMVSNDTVLIYVDGKLAQCYWNIGSPGSGYVNNWEDRTWTRREFGSMQDALSWTRDEPANAVLSRLLRGRRAKLVETRDGLIELSTYDQKIDIGVWSSPVIRQGSVVTPRPSIVGMIGAEVQAFYLEPDMAKLALRFRQSESPTVITEAETLAEAQLVSELAEEQAVGQESHLQIMDPRAMIERLISFEDGPEATHYIIDSFNFSFSTALDGIESTMVARLRQLPEEEEAGVWGIDKWGKFYWG